MTIKRADLHDAYGGSFYFIAGTGGDLNEWVEGYEDLLKQMGIGTPVEWFFTYGKDINDYAGEDNTNPFQPDVTCLLFPLSNLDVSRLAMFKLRMGDRWFDDVIDNMRPWGEDDCE